MFRVKGRYNRSFFKNNYNPNGNLPNKNHVNKLSISLLNIRSINNKSFYISDIITTHSPDFLDLTETWHEDATSPSLVTATPLNYSFLSSSHSTYGGVCLFYKSSFSASRHSSFKFISFECLVSSFKARLTIASLLLLSIDLLLLHTLYL